MSYLFLVSLHVVGIESALFVYLKVIRVYILYVYEYQGGGDLRLPVCVRVCVCVSVQYCCLVYV